MPQREPSETRILTVASEHLRTFGLKRFTVVAVAEEAGMTHANVYRYFPSRVALIDAVVDLWLKATERKLADIADGPDPADDKLERLILGLARPIAIS
jgi:AcrR family transcriptional regulator